MAVISEAEAATQIVTKRSIPFISAYHAGYIESDVERLSVDEALKLADADFTVEGRKVYTHTPKGHRVTIPGYKANVRTDTEDVLGLVGESYEIVQTREAIDPIVTALLKTGEVDVNSAWTLRQGRSVGITLALPNSRISIGDKDLVDMFLMIRTSHDGQSSVMGDIGPTRLRCLNMVRLFERTAAVSFKIKHTGGALVKLGDARNVLERAGAYVKAFERDADRLLNTKLVESQVREILDRAFGAADPEASGAQLERTINFKVFRNWQESDTIADVRETGWGLVNATNEYFEHVAPTRTRTFDVQSARGISILQGTASQSTNKVAALVRAA